MTSSREQWREGRRRPLQGNAPPGRAGKPGVLSFRSVCDPAFSRHFPASRTDTEGPRYAFLRHRGIYRSDVVWKDQPRNRTLPPPDNRSRSRVKERAGRITLFSSSAMSSGRLFLAGLVATRAPLRFAGTRRLTRIFHSLVKRGRFYFAGRGTFLLCLDSPGVTSSDIAVLQAVSPGSVKRRATLEKSAEQQRAGLCSHLPLRWIHLKPGCI
jgi:hypothetical protein